MSKSSSFDKKNENFKIKEEPPEYSDNNVDDRDYSVSPTKKTPYLDYFNRKDTSSSSGITVSEYIVNNYPNRNLDNYTDAITMVPLTSTSMLQDTSIRKENLRYKLSTTPDDDQSTGKDDFPMDVEEIKKARRRLKNKISAQESRRRKKEYVDALEAKLKQRDQEKNLLKDKVTELEDKIRSLVDELFELKQSTPVSYRGEDITKSHSHAQSSYNFEKLNQLIESNHSRPQTVSSISRATQTGVCLLCYANETGLTEEQMKTKHFETSYNRAMSPCPSAGPSSPHSTSLNNYPISDSTLEDRDSNEEDEDDDIDIEFNRPTSRINTPKNTNEHFNELSQIDSYSNNDFTSTPPRLLKRSQSAFDNDVSSAFSRTSRLFTPYSRLSQINSIRTYSDKSPQERYKSSFNGDLHRLRTEESSSSPQDAVFLGKIRGYHSQ